MKTTPDSHELYKASTKEPTLINVPQMQYLMIDGHGKPETSHEFQDAIQALYGIAYTLKFSRKKRGEDSTYKIPPLEGLWWADDNRDFEAGGNPEAWQWTLMIAQPDFITRKEFNDAVKELVAKKPETSAAKFVRLEKWKEGPSVQVMHVGPYAEEWQTIKRLMEYAERYGVATGKHHEIYLGDPRRSAPEKLKTILRHPVKLRSRKAALQD